MIEPETVFFYPPLKFTQPDQTNACDPSLATYPVVLLPLPSLLATPPSSHSFSHLQNQVCVIAAYSFCAFSKLLLHFHFWVMLTVYRIWLVTVVVLAVLPAAGRTVVCIRASYAQALFFLRRALLLSLFTPLLSHPFSIYIYIYIYV